jgi:death-on-curing protein
VTEYLDPEDVEELLRTLGLHIRDRSLLLSALAAPLPVFDEEVYAGPHEKAAALIAAINRNHPLLDGNKRLSWIASVAFLELNGLDLAAASVAEGDSFVRAVAADRLTHAEIVEWLARHTTDLT